ncbi:MAG: hydrogenase maturation protease, partial [Tepidisphaerales bacterium]
RNVCPTVLVVGIGSLIRGDDGAGRLVAERLADSLHLPGVEVMSVHQLTPELAEVISRSGVFVVVDTSAVDPPGKLVCRQVEPAAGIDPGAHICTPASLLAWSRWLYGRFPPAFIFSVGGEKFDITEELTPMVQRGAAELQIQIEAYVRVLLGWLSAGKRGTIPLPALLPAR